MDNPAAPPISPPHAPLAQHYGSEADRRRYLHELFDHTAGDYERVERVVALGSGRRYRRDALRRAGLEPGMRVVDVGVGTGLVASEAATLTGDPTLVVGVDPSVGMLANAKVPVGVRLLEGRAEAIPLPDASADFLSMGYALRHVDDLGAAFNEFRRVLAPGGKLVLLEITKPEGKIAGALLRAYMGGFAPLIARLFGRTAKTVELYDYYWATIAACVPPARILAALLAAGFTEVERYVELGVFSEYRARSPQ